MTFDLRYLSFRKGRINDKRTLVLQGNVNRVRDCMLKRIGWESVLRERSSLAMAVFTVFRGSSRWLTNEKQFPRDSSYIYIYRSRVWWSRDDDRYVGEKRMINPRPVGWTWSSVPIIGRVGSIQRKEKKIPAVRDSQIESRDGDKSCVYNRASVFDGNHWQRKRYDGSIIFNPA